MAWSRAKPKKFHRPPRILVPNDEKAVFTVAGEKFVGVIQRLSLTGGSVLFSKGPVADGSVGEMLLNTVYGNVMADIQFLHAGADGVPLAQAFCFLEMDDVSTRRFQAAAEKMESAGFSDVEEVEATLADRTRLALGNAGERVLGLGAKIAGRLLPRKS
jgi:hypothetical protein